MRTIEADEHNRVLDVGVPPCSASGSEIDDIKNGEALGHLFTPQGVANSLHLGTRPGNDEGHIA